MQYICKRCGYTTDVKQNMQKHLNRKKKCTSVYEDIDTNILLEELNTKQMADTTYDCPYCARKFNDRSNMCKHAKRCKSNHTDLEQMHNKIKLLEAKVASLEGNVNLCTPHMVTNNIQQNNIVNINLKDFGMETQSHLTTDFLNKCFADKGIVDLIEGLHFDQDCPQNHNVRLKSKKQELMEVFSNGQWMVKDQDKTLTELIQSGYRILRMHGKKHKDVIMEDEDIDEADYQEVVEWLETIYNDSKAQKPLKRDLIILFLNNQAMLLERNRND